MKIIIYILLFAVLNGCTSNTNKPASHNRKKIESTCNNVEHCIAYISGKIHRFWVFPVGFRKGLRLKLRVKLNSYGEITNIVITESSGNQEFDDIALKTINSASPFSALIGLDKKTFRENFTEIPFIFDSGVIPIKRKKLIIDYKTKL